ncbi:MAG: MotA/TolQ/ExbB proton channel family protein [Gammaproteobacteria bacterium]
MSSMVMHTRPTVERGEHHSLLLWLIFTGLVFFGLFLAIDYGLIATLIETDRSKISIVIMLIYFLVTCHCAVRVTQVSRELNETRRLASELKSNPDYLTETNSEGMSVFLQKQPRSVIRDYICDLFRKYRTDRGTDEIPGHDLLEVYAAELKNPQEIGWFISDIMLKLGLVGTIVGFIVMLSSVANITDFDVSTMQKILQLMSSGMGTALYTTLTGLAGSVLAATQYYIIDRTADENLAVLQHLTEIDMHIPLSRVANS